MVWMARRVFELCSRKFATQYCSNPLNNTKETTVEKGFPDRALYLQSLVAHWHDSRPKNSQSYALGTASIRSGAPREPGSVHGCNREDKAPVRPHRQTHSIPQPPCPGYRRRRYRSITDDHTI
ncbi:hypothetical protein RSAG8_06940, partial [Rhizoctonia solani AG-8 WAC10335]